MPPARLRPLLGLALALAACALAAARAHAVLDIQDKGPLLRAGRFSMRVTNAGILGNAFFDPGLSYDPSFEYPRGSSQELLNHAELWVGAIDERGVPRVSGGPMLEWRPTLDSEDRVREAWSDRLGARRLVDDDHDGTVDEEALDARDDDGDGEVDEDLGMFSQQMLASDYVDDRPEATQIVYPSGELHVPLGLSVREEEYAWSWPGADRIAGMSFRITNHGDRALRNLYLGLLVDLDSRQRQDRTGHLNDRVRWLSYARRIPLGVSRVTVNGVSQDPPTLTCFDDLRQTLPAVVDGVAGSGLPCVAVVPLEHTIDPYAAIAALEPYARAPRSMSFRSVVFRRNATPGSGGLPLLDAQRYDALAGLDRGSEGEGLGDWLVLVSCGPFPRLAPGQSIQLTAALVAADRPDSLAVAMGDAAVLQRGTRLNLIADSTGAWPFDFDQGVSGINGHEACVEPPPGVSFVADPNCPGKLRGELPPELDRPVLYSPGRCVWTDADCDECTGLNGFETPLRWLDPGDVPPSPRLRVVPGDRAVEIAWDNTPEVLLAGRLYAAGASRFLGYRLYRIDDWRGREALLPPPDHWGLLAAFADSTKNGETLLASVTDPTVDYERILFERRLYPPGRYRTRDTLVHNGFPYLYAVTSVVELVTGGPGAATRRVLESPILATFDQAVSPQSPARASAGQVWVVPNPFRARADWDLPPVDGDRLTRHIDFMGLPRARCTIKIWTVAGDLVQRIDHDASGGDGQAAWDLVSRNGQEVQSGIYLFTVDSPLGHQVGRFVVVR